MKHSVELDIISIKRRRESQRVRDVVYKYLKKIRVRFEPCGTSEARTKKAEVNLLH